MALLKLTNVYSLGSLIRNVKGIYNKVNEIIDYIHEDVKPYKSYVALLNQTGTDAPVATVFENTLGVTPVWSYEGVGYYEITSVEGTFPEGNTVILGLTPYSGLNNNTTAYIAMGSNYDDGASLYMEAGSISTDLTTFTKTEANGIVFNTPIEIRVYA